MVTSQYECKVLEFDVKSQSSKLKPWQNEKYKTNNKWTYFNHYKGTLVSHKNTFYNEVYSMKKTIIEITPFFLQIKTHICLNILTTQWWDKFQAFHILYLAVFFVHNLKIYTTKNNRIKSMDLEFKKHIDDFKYCYTSKPL